ncbi:MAG: ATP-binding protein [Paracoccaceae bacterium]
MSIAEKLARERRSRLAAERLLDQKQRELFAANAQLSRHARLLSDQIVEQRKGLSAACSEAETLRGENWRAMHELELANVAAKIAQRRLWEAVETIEDGFAVFDHDLCLIAANRAWFDLLGNHADIVPGVGYGTVLRVLADTRIAGLDAEAAQDWCHVMTERVTRAVIKPTVVRLSDGRHIRFIDRHGDGGDLVSMALDITDTMHREAELEEARQRAEAASRAKSAFLANMSHEIRTPMNGVVGMADLLCETTLNEDQRSFAETIRSSGEALLAIINDVLDYSKIEAAKLTLHPEPFDLERCIHEVVLLLMPAARDKGLTTLVDFDLFLPTRYIGDRGRIRQILTNLLGNAVKFTAAGHVLTRVVGLELPDGRFDLHVTVEDTGIGIAADQIDHVFGEFNQVEDQSNRKFEGTGLGLSITRRLVELMGGAVWVDSEPGQGSCFGFRIALTPAEPCEPVGLTGRPILLKRALVIDGSQINRMILERQLAAYGLAVTTCRSTHEALEMLEKSAGFDIVLADGDRPEVDNAALGAGLRAEGEIAPLVLLCDDPAVAPDESGDVAAVLRKPILRSTLYQLLERLSHPGPLAPDQDAGATEAPANPPVGLRPMRILAAEDNRTNQLIFRKMVAELDIDLMFANNGAEAVVLWRSFRPDLIFMDISMPEMDGRQAAQAIRDAEAENAAVPIVALTAHAMEDDRALILASGIDRVLTKPLKKAAIAAQIGEFCPADARPAVPAKAQ